MQVTLDKIASVTARVNLSREVEVSSTVVAERGAVIIVEALEEKSVYGELELLGGRMARIIKGDIIAGVVGERQALKGFVGAIPGQIAAGDILHILNLGGVIGECVSHNPEVGSPFEFEVLGQVLVYPEFQSREGQAANIRMGALQQEGRRLDCKVIYVAGTCMNAGKTAAACALVRRLTQAGFRGGGAKLTGVSLMRDTLSMRDYGAGVTYDFTDAGIVCTGHDSANQVARTLFAQLSGRGLDVIVAETGDGIMGDYGVQAILADPELKALTAGFVFCANDPVGVAGGVRHLKSEYGIDADVVTGPATDNNVGVRFVEREVGLRAINARTNSKAFGEHLLEVLATRGIRRQ